MNNQMPLQIQILTNLDCNLRCTYCYENKDRGANNFESMRNFINARYKENIPQNADRDVVIDFIGGETLMYPLMLDRLCGFTHCLHYMHHNNKGNLTFNISTNGTLIERQDVKDFLLKWKNHLSLGFSIDGTKEIHDDCRIDTQGKGSYDRAVAGYEWAKKNLCSHRIGVKATYCHKTIDRYAEGVINLIKLGFTNIAANVIFEETWTKEESPAIASQLNAVTDYLFENGLEEKVHLFQINHEDLDMRHYKAESGRKDQNHCGTCTHMLCLGFDNKLYGCNRFCTMKNPIPIGDLTDSTIKITNKQFIKEVSEQYLLWPRECKECPYETQCASCSAIPYETENVREYINAKTQCGFTHAVVAARLYFKYRLLSKGE